MRALPFKRVMLDGEAVAHCLDGLPDFHRLLGDGQATACFYWLEAQDVRGLELIGRRRMLQKALRKTGEALRFSEHLSAEQGEAMFRHACAMGLEGIVSKRVTSRYSGDSRERLLSRWCERNDGYGLAPADAKRSARTPAISNGDNVPTCPREHRVHPENRALEPLLRGYR